MCRFLRPATALVLLPLLTALPCPAAPSIYNSEPGDPSPIPADEALRQLKLPEGFNATLFAAEPEIQNPIAAAWDHRGRLWVAENYTYAERQKRFDLELDDRLIVFEDRDNDGRADSRKIFTDKVKLLTSVETGMGGVWLMCPPQLLFIPDADGDAVPDGPPQVVLDGFDVAKDNYHNLANGLRWGPDGWLYGRCGHSCPAKPGIPGTPEKERPSMKGGIWRYHPVRKTVEVLTTGAVNSWGHDWDRHGEGFFINTVIGHLWHIIPGADFKESGTSVSPHPDYYERMDMIADHYHFDTNGKWQDSRDGAANDFGGGHAHIGAMIYQGEGWPEKYRDRLFTLNMHGRRANVERLERTGSGYVGKHDPDVFFWEDPWFRGIEITQGPDGSAFVLDWSDTGECHDHTGVHRTSGRIYKIRHGQPAAPDLSDLGKITPDGAERLIRNPNVWYERQLRVRLMTQPPAPEVRDRILKLATGPENSTITRLRALWTSHAIGALKEDTMLGLLGEKDEHLRVWGIRFLTDAVPIDYMGVPRLPDTPQALLSGTFGKFKELARTDSSGLVKLTLASALQRLGKEQRSELAVLLAADATYADDPQMPFMIWYGILPLAGGFDPGVLDKIAAVTSSPKLARWTGRFLANPAPDPFRPAQLQNLLAAPIPEKMRPALVAGISDALNGISKAEGPPNWSEFAATVTDPASQPAIQRISLLYGDRQVAESLQATVRNEDAPMGERQAALDILIDAKIPGLRELCESVLGTPKLNGNAIRGLALSGDPEVARLLAANFGKFEPVSQGHLIDAMTGRPDWATVLLDEISAGRIPKTALPAFSARRIVALKNNALTKRLNEVWGSLGSSAADKTKEIAALKKKLTPQTLAAADLKNGRQLYAGICGACHTLYGEGGKIGPDLTGSGRTNLDYLLENIVDPSAVVSADHRITTVTLNDGRVISGTLGAKTDRTLTVKSPAGDTTVEISNITKQESTTTSLMPEGLLTAFQPDQVRDLIAYLMHPMQVE
ncbi:c-type cytochrome [Luteolibacter sp. SL250]|uniref:PVC-type heme-binding CxxCH protein n=1 Tax=Luteolibacter sp. SL250 TaxID=2995170 RepID=UPI002270D311|nr:PVC-type heme-binding CxxCH protein [Luteolibacter sp. SL250]WAC18655.1 c-type cytochrome [Luteolibacter sp. SL250]